MPISCVLKLHLTLVFNNISSVITFCKTNDSITWSYHILFVYYPKRWQASTIPISTCLLALLSYLQFLYYIHNVLVTCFLYVINLNTVCSGVLFMSWTWGSKTYIIFKVRFSCLILSKLVSSLSSTTDYISIVFFKSSVLTMDI